jgi:hypothetical protein
MIMGIVGSEATKFCERTELEAKAVIEQILKTSGVTGYSSGHCHLGGVDIWTEEIGDGLGLRPYIFRPRVLSWEGYKERNIQIAQMSAEVHCITVKTLPPGYTGMRFDLCYHCKTKDHVKSGGCWTAKYAQKCGKRATWHIL